MISPGLHYKRKPVKRVAVSKRRRLGLGCFGRIFLTVIIWDLMWVGVLRLYFVLRNRRNLPQSYAFSDKVQGRYDFDGFSDMQSEDSDNPVTTVPMRKCLNDQGDLFPDRDGRFIVFDISVTPEFFVVSVGDNPLDQKTYVMGKDVLYLGDGTFMFREISGNGGNIMIIPSFGFSEKITYVTFCKEALDVEVRKVGGEVSGFGFFLPFFMHTRSRMRFPVSSEQDKLNSRSVYALEKGGNSSSFQLGEDDSHE